MTSKLTVGLIAIILFVFSGAAAIHAQKPADAIDSTQSQLPGIQTDLLEVRLMSDNTIRVRWRWRNTTDKPVLLPGASAWLEHETYLLDPVNKKKHFVVTDAKGVAIGSPLGDNFGNQTIEGRQAPIFWAKFPAPPGSVAKISVVIAKTPPFEDIAIAK